MNLLASALTGTSLTHNLGYLQPKTGSLEMLLCVMIAECAALCRKPCHGGHTRLPCRRQAAKQGITWPRPYAETCEERDMGTLSFSACPVEHMGGLGTKAINERIARSF